MRKRSLTTLRNGIEYRFCLQCENTKPLTKFDKTGSYIKQRCKQCLDSNDKQCSTCHQDKPKSDFSVLPNGTMMSVCKRCDSLKIKAYINGVPHRNCVTCKKLVALPSLPRTNRGYSRVCHECKEKLNQLG